MGNGRTLNSGHSVLRPPGESPWDCEIALDAAGGEAGHNVAKRKGKNTATKWKVFKEEGVFEDFSGSMTYDPASSEASAIEVIVQAASLDTRNATRDKVLRSDDFFDAEKYPHFRFAASRSKPPGLTLWT